MQSGVGLWMDHRRAVIVTVLGEAEMIVRLASNVEKHVRYSGAA
jgi:hypothetical protein